MVLEMTLQPEGKTAVPIELRGLSLQGSHEIFVELSLGSERAALQLRSVAARCFRLEIVYF